MGAATERDTAQASPEELLAAAADALEAMGDDAPAGALDHVDAAMAALHPGP